jgi:hypothetical protein
MMTTEEWEWLHLLRQLCRDGCTFSEAAHIAEERYPTPVVSGTAVSDTGGRHQWYPTPVADTGKDYRRVARLRPEAHVNQPARKALAK